MQNTNAPEIAPTGRTTPRKTRAKRLASVALAGSLIFAACGSDDSPSTSGEAAAPTAENADVMLGAFGPACDAVPQAGEGSFDGMADDPAATAASNNPLLSTLVTAVTEAGLVDTLNGDGPFTIFAPTNDAFAAIPEDTLAMVLADQELLTTILTYHVVGGASLDAAELGSAVSSATVQGDQLEFGPDGTTVNGVNVICSDVPTANATVHIVDAVLLPPAVQAALAGGDEMSEDEMSDDAMSEDEMSEDTMAGALEPSGVACAAVPTSGEGSFDGMADDPAATAASNNPELSTLVTAVSEAGLVDTLNGDGPFTIFAPINSAFAAIPEADLAAVLADQDVLTGILTYHVVIGEQLSSADLVELGMVTTANGADLTITSDGGTLMVNGASSVCMDVPTANATVHLIDSVLMPS